MWCIHLGRAHALAILGDLGRSDRVRMVFSFRTGCGFQKRSRMDAMIDKFTVAKSNRVLVLHVLLKNRLSLEAAKA